MEHRPELIFSPVMVLFRKERARAGRQLESLCFRLRSSSRRCGDPKTLYRMITRCITKHADGCIHGFRGAIPYARLKAHHLYQQYSWRPRRRPFRGVWRGRKELGGRACPSRGPQKKMEQAPARSASLRSGRIDGHKIDLRVTLRITDPLRFQHLVELTRIWILVVLGIASRAVNGCKLALSKVALVASGDRECARAGNAKVLALDPGNRHATEDAE